LIRNSLPASGTVCTVTFVTLGTDGKQKSSIASSSSGLVVHLSPSISKIPSLEVNTMRVKWTSFFCALTLALAVSAIAQDNRSSNPQERPVLKTRQPDNGRSLTPPDFQPQPAQTTTQAPAPVQSTPADAIPAGSRFILSLQDTLDTHNMEQGQHFTAELRENLFTPSGLVILKGRCARGHVAVFEHGFTGARMLLAMDEIETAQGWVPLIATFTGVPGDPSIKSTGQEGEITRKGPDLKRVIANAAIGAGIGAATGAATGGGKGAAAGAVAGAGLGTTASFLMKGNDLKLDKGTNLEVRLDRDLMVSTK
jgi:hypothetical protein